MRGALARLRSASSWTGGQYSLYRWLLGGLLCLHCVLLLADHGHEGGRAPLAFGALASLALAAGWRDRAAALALLGTGFWLLLAGPPSAPAPSPWVGCLLLVHVCLPRAPYGSFDARGRLDPDGGWRLASAWIAVTWIALLLGYAHAGYQRLESPLLSGDGPWLPALLALEFAGAPLALLAGLRPWLWLALLAVHAIPVVCTGAGDPASGVLALHALTLDPAWLPRRGAPARIFYDGGCGLCHRAVRFVLAEDRAERFRFAPLASASFAEAVPASERAELPDSIVLVTDSGERLVRSDALLRIGLGLGGAWRALAGAARLVPRPLRDAAYDGIARLRPRLFARPAEACPIVPPELRARFEA